MWERYVITRCETENRHRLGAADSGRLFGGKRMTRKTPSSMCLHLPLMLQPPPMTKICIQLKDTPYQRTFSLNVWWICHDSLYVSRNPLYNNMYHKHALHPKVWTRSLISQIGAGHPTASETGSSKVDFLKITVFSGSGALNYPEGRKKQAGSQFSQQCTAGHFWPGHSFAASLKDTCSRPK